MHVHSYFSGPCTTPFVSKFCRESFNDPVELYALLVRRGMNLYTLTDHDSIDGTEILRGRPGFFQSEELTCRMPSGTEVHIGVYDLTERQHMQLQQRRSDLGGLDALGDRADAESGGKIEDLLATMHKKIDELRAGG